ncbi:MAG TPA: serine/threonine-protein kinase [Gemmatimonadales bacterium]|nr:serine/threonine-protein kinase [Gemmatimonadales bacterium]
MTGEEESRAFLQERLAFLGKTYTLIDRSFALVSRLVAVPLLGWAGLLLDMNGGLVLSASAIFLVQWLACRRGRWSERSLRLIDAASTIGAGAVNAGMVFAAVPGELPGLSYGRALLIFTMTIVVRAVIVPSSARRTLVLGLLAACFPVAAAHLWYSSHPAQAIPPVFQTMWTALWCLGGVVISTVASQVIFGLRRQVREATQLGQYTLLEKIGSGGMGEVYRASHAMLRRPTAVKLLLPGRTSAEHLRRFEREVQLTSRLTHPNTVAVFDYGRTVDGIFYYAMEYLDGVNLEDLVRRDGAQPPGRVRHILRQVAGSLAEAHGVGLIHRDIKPGNVILVPERGGARDVAKVVDFGLVRDLEQEREAGDDEDFAGTPLYLAPESITSPETVDARSDLYAFGCVGYFLLTGRPVFEGETVAEVVGRHLHAPPIPPEQRIGGPLPASLTTLVLSCLEKDPDRRPASALECIAVLDRCVDVPGWTDEQAARWWSVEGTRLLSRSAAARAEPSTAEVTVMRPGLVTLSEAKGA